MADNVTANPGTGGASFATDDVGGAHHPYAKIEWGADGAATKVDDVAGSRFPVKLDGTKYFAIAASAMMRPANTTAYAANDAVSNNATAGSVTAISFTLSDTDDHPITLERLRILTTDTGPSTASAQFRAWLYQSDPTASSGVVGGDNAAFSTKQGTFIGTMSGVFRAFSDGGGAILVPDEGARIITMPTSGARTIYTLLQTLTAFTPSANSTTFTGTLEGFQGRT